MTIQTVSSVKSKHFCEKPSNRWNLNLLEIVPARPGRPRVLPSLCLWSGLLVCVLQGFSNQLAVWRLLTVNGFWSYPRFDLCDQAIYKRLANGGTAVLEQLFEQISAVLGERLDPFKVTNLAPFASEIVALDCTTLDKIARYLPSYRDLPAGDSQLLPGKLAALFDIRRQQWRRIQSIDNPHENDKVTLEKWSNLAERRSDTGRPGLLQLRLVRLLDRYALLVAFKAAQQDHLQRHPYLLHGWHTFDGLIWLGKYRSDKAAHAVRLVQFQVGKKTYRYITNVLDANVLPIDDIARLYARRWDIETRLQVDQTSPQSASPVEL